jgi:molecular chaperone DnaK (HSP70)
MRYSRGYPSWTKSGHELTLVPINPVVRRRIIDLPIFRRRAKPTANDLYVAMGAAVQEAAPPRAEVPTVLVDITPYAFGTSAVSDLEGEPYPYCHVPIIKKNTPIPVCKSKAFRAIRDDLDMVDVKIVRGKKTDALKNIQLGKFRVEGLRVRGGKSNHRRSETRSRRHPVCRRQGEEYRT